MQKFIAQLTDTPRKRKILYFGVLPVLLLMSVDRLLFGTIIDKVNTLAEEVEEQKSIISRDLAILAKKEEITNKANAFRQYFASEVQDDDVVNAQFLSTIEKLATQAKVNLIKSNPTENKKEKFYNHYFANLDCVGELNDVVTFMYKINDSPELLKVVRFTITPKRGGASDKEVNASMTVSKLIVSSDKPI